jgi:hypothetical protein
MKNLWNIGLILIFIGFQSCKKNQEQEKVDTTQVETTPALNDQCYQALYKKDTLDLRVKTLSDGTISGDLVMNVFNEPLREGEIKGEFHGDTLFCSYTFILTKNKAVTYKNPMAFLKKGDELILGDGEIQMYLGASYFKKDTPIDFENVKYRFTPSDCLNKN